MSAVEEHIPRLARPSRRGRVLGYVLAIILLILAARYISAHESCRELILVSPTWFPALGLVVISSLVLRAWFVKQLAGELGARIPAQECFYLVGATNMFEALTLPAAGVAYRGLHLHRAWGVPLVSYMAGLAVFALARLVVWGLSIIGCLIWIALHGGDVRRSIAFLLLAGLIALAVAWACQSILRRLAGQRSPRFGRLADGCLRVTSSKRIRISAFIAMLGCASSHVLAFYTVFRSSGLPVDPISSTVIAAFHQLSGGIGFTPGGLGLQEAAGLLSSTMLGVGGVADMLIVLALMRVGRVLLALAVGGPCWWLLPAEDAESRTALVPQESPETAH